MCDAKQHQPAMNQAARYLNEWAREKGIIMRELAECTDVPYTLLWQAEKGDDARPGYRRPARGAQPVFRPAVIQFVPIEQNRPSRCALSRRRDRFGWYNLSGSNRPLFW